MIVIGIAAILSAVVVLLLLRPLLRAAPVSPLPDQAAHLLAEQIATMDSSDLAKAEVELARRRLRAAAVPVESVTDAPPPRWLAPAVALALPVIALSFYLPLGRPDQASEPAAAFNQAERTAHAQAVAGLGRLRAQLKRQPNDWLGWVLLAVGDARMERPARAVEAWRQAAELRPEHIGLRAALAEALVRQDGLVTPEAASLFAGVLAARPDDPRARYYLALAAEQAGRHAAALADFRALAAESAADSAWRPTVVEHIERLSATLGQPADVPPPVAEPADPAAAPLLDPAQTAAMADADPTTRMATIRAMVERLAARLQTNPDDPAGWARLARARATLGQTAESRAALAQAAARAPKDMDIQISHADALRAAAAGKLSAEFRAQIAHMRAIEPDNAYVLWWDGMIRGADGDRPGARAAWNRLLDRLPPESDEFLEVAAAYQTLIDP